MTLRARGRLITGAVLFMLVVVPQSAGAFELSGGVDMGWIFAGPFPRLVLGPHAGISWRLESGLLFVAHDLVGILPPIDNGGVGVHNQTSAAVG